MLSRLIPFFILLGVMLFDIIAVFSPVRAAPPLCAPRGGRTPAADGPRARAGLGQRGVPRRRQGEDFQPLSRFVFFKKWRTLVPVALSRTHALAPRNPGANRETATL
eukprot:SAG31_NODE_1405_length_8488_cov_2.786029_2_plen_107_part_00